MLLRLALCIAVTALAAAVAQPQPSWAQKPADAPPGAASKPDAAPTVPAAPAAPAPPTTHTQPGDPFGEDVTLAAKPIVYVKGSGNWDSAFAIITKALKTVKAYADKAGLKPDGQPMTIFTSTDDKGFDYEVAIPIAEPPKNPPHGEVSLGTSPEGHALKFVHRGSYDGLDDTYEAITNYLDERRLEAKDMFIEQYETDPLTANADHLVVNIFVPVK